MKEPTKNLSIGFLYDDTLDSNDGVAQYVKTLGTWLTNQGHHVSYLVGETSSQSFNGGKVYSLSKNLHLKWAGNRLSISLIPKIKYINQVLSKNHFDVIHVQEPYSPFMAQRVVNRISPDVALVGTFHVFPANKLVKYISKFLKIVYGSSLRRFDYHSSVSPAAGSYAKEVFGIDSIILPNVVDLKRFRSSRSKPNSPKKIVFLGRLVKRKGCMYLLKAYRQLAKQMPDSKLVVAGDGPMRTKLERFVMKNGLADKVEFLGYINEIDKPGLLSSADIACFPSLYGESFGIVLIEAMAASARVVLGGDNPGYATVLTGQPNALIDPRDSDEFAQRLEKLLTDENLISNLHAWQTEQLKKYDVAEVGPKIVAAYGQAIASRNKSRHN